MVYIDTADLVTREEAADILGISPAQFSDIESVIEPAWRSGHFRLYDRNTLSTIEQLPVVPPSYAGPGKSRDNRWTYRDDDFYYSSIAPQNMRAVGSDDAQDNAEAWQYVADHFETLKEQLRVERNDRLEKTLRKDNKE